MRTTIDPIFQESSIKTQQRQIQLIRHATTQSEKIRSGNWKVIPYSTLKNIYHYYEWSKKIILKDSSYANQKEYLILRQGWNPERDAGYDRAYVYKYHQFKKDAPPGQRFRFLKLEGKQASIQIQEKHENGWKAIYQRDINL